MTNFVRVCAACVCFSSEALGSLDGFVFFFFFFSIWWFLSIVDFVMFCLFGVEKGFFFPRLDWAAYVLKDAVLENGVLGFCYF
jgi:hypothetical protein